MLEHTQRISKIPGAVIEWNLVDTCQMKSAIRQAVEVRPGDIERIFARVDAMEHPYPGCTQPGPSTASATEVKTLCAVGQMIPGKDCEIILEEPT